MLQRKQILVVEDNLLNREMLTEILSEQYSVLEAGNGQEALEVLKQYGDHIALILLDVMMPVMDGFAFLDRVKADAKLSLIPVIVMTQSENERDEVAALVHGATDFVPKPYRPQIILHRVASIIKLRETAAIVNQFQYDRLTGLYSKEFFYQKVREQLQENPDKEFAIVCANVENFKLYNDAFGVAAGDRLLQDISAFFREQGEGEGFCGRYEADRFLCLKERSGNLKEKIRSALKVWKEHFCHTQNVVIKMGVYEVTDRSVPVEQMCDRALLAVDSIKGQYNQQFAVYDDALRGKLLREQAITEAMETALNEGQFSVYFQPKYSLNNDSLVGAEALVRWNHPEWGFMSPGEFIPLFEKNGFITRLDQYVWEKVCAQLREWRERALPILSVSVNVSRADIYQSRLTDTLLGIVGKYGIEPKYLHLEITESAYTENPDQIIETVEQLRNQGFIIEMDDFGSGYSSLSMLNQMKLDVLKLDMKFIQSETAKPTEQGILRFIVGLARWMNLSVVAEGVETRQQLERLREIGCDYVQGYFFAKPMPAEEFEHLLKNQGEKEMAPLPAKHPFEFALRSLLVVDEDSEYRKSICRLFDGQYRILEASDGRSAFDCIMAEKKPVSGIILSAVLPDGGAKRFLEELRQDPKIWRIPVLATIPQGESANGLVEELDTDDFLCKRHPMSDLRRRVERMVRVASYLERERDLQDAACRDYLTNLLNRRGLYDAIDGLRQVDLPLAMYLFDLDDLKRVNDRYGHEMGDKLLMFFGQVLRNHTRTGDILCRYGGDEFIVILKQISSVETIMRKGGEICQAFHDFQLPDGSCATCSGGVVLCGVNERPSTEMIRRIDTALYRAKQEHKGSCFLWEEEEKQAGK